MALAGKIEYEDLKKFLAYYFLKVAYIESYSRVIRGYNNE